jgi:glycosyltransferase involved in cell wall biosynthesis
MDNGGTNKLLIIGRVGIDYKNIAETIISFGEKVILISNATDSEVFQAYSCAEAVINASRYEGYGMSVCEGIEYNGRVLANALSVFGEFAGSLPYYFNIDTKGDLANLMLKCQQLVKRQIKLPVGTWANTAENLSHEISKTGDFFSKQPAIEICANSAEAVRWATWMLFSHSASQEEITFWLKYDNTDQMIKHMMFEYNKLN